LKWLYKFLPWFVLAFFGSAVVGTFMPRHDKGEFHVRAFGQLPVLLNGRVQPFDSVGHNALLQIRSTSDVPLEEVPSWQFWHHAEKLTSSAWLLEVMGRPDLADGRPIFLVHNPELLGELNLGNVGVEKSGLHYYSYNQLVGVMPIIMQQAAKVQDVDEKTRTPLQRQVYKLANAIILYSELKLTLHPKEVEDLAGQMDQIQLAIGPGVTAISAKEDGKPFNQQDYDRLVKIWDMYAPLEKDPNGGQRYPLVIPPVDPASSNADWGNVGFGVIESLKTGTVIPPVHHLVLAMDAFKNGKATAFNQAVDSYTDWLQQFYPKQLAKGRHEFKFNELKLFLYGIIMYIPAFLLACGSLLTFGTFTRLSESLRRSSFYLILLAFCLHTTGLVFRMYLEGRPPVTNLYSSAIFIGWAAVVIGIGLEWVYRLGIGNLVASLAGFVTLLIAQSLALGGDTMEMMRAVLDTNFWLATHVVVVTLGYAATFFAGLLGITYIMLGLFTPVLAEKVGSSETKRGKPSSQTDVGRALSMMAYAVICFATLFSFVGTVLGGIWADQSWGRFWGWDPKENGALIIVLWNAVILHARWGGLVRERGLMNLAVFGNVVTSFSWFGVNMLGIGLHSYGFMDAAFQWLRGFVALQLFIIALGILPMHYWRSFQARLALKTPPGPGGKPRPAQAAG